MQQYRSSSNDTHVILIKLSINNAVSTKYDVHNLAASLGARVGLRSGQGSILLAWR